MYDQDTAARVHYAYAHSFNKSIRLGAWKSCRRDSLSTLNTIAIHVFEESNPFLLISASRAGANGEMKRKSRVQRILLANKKKGKTKSDNTMEDCAINPKRTFVLQCARTPRQDLHG